MKHAIITLLIAVAALLALAGCGHNVANYTNGDHTAFGVTMTESGYPIFGFKRTSGENLTVAVKDNTLVNVSLENGAAASGGGESATSNATGSTSRVSGLLMYTGDQTTGYDVDMAKAVAEFDTQAAKKIAAKQNATFVDGKLDKNGKFVVTEVKLGKAQAKADSASAETSGSGTSVNGGTVSTPAATSTATTSTAAADTATTAAKTE